MVAISVVAEVLWVCLMREPDMLAVGEWKKRKEKKNEKKWRDNFTVLCWEAEQCNWCGVVMLVTRWCSI